MLPVRRGPTGTRLTGSTAFALLALVLGIGIFAVDMFSPLGGAIAVLYTICIILLMRAGRPAMVALGGIGAAIAAMIAFIAGHWGEAVGAAHVRLGVSLAAIGVTTILSYGMSVVRTFGADRGVD